MLIENSVMHLCATITSCPKTTKSDELLKGIPSQTICVTSKSLLFFKVSNPKSTRLVVSKHHLTPLFPGPIDHCQLSDGAAKMCFAIY